MTTDGDQQRRGTELYPFPGGVFERWGNTDDAGPGVYVEFHHARPSCNDARAFGPGEEAKLPRCSPSPMAAPAERLGSVDDETEPA